MDKGAYINKLIGYENGRVYFRGICDISIDKKKENVIRPYSDKVFYSTEPIILEDFLSGQINVSDFKDIGMEYSRGMFLKGIATIEGLIIPDNLIARYQSLLSIFFNETILDVTLTPKNVFRIIKLVKENPLFINSIFPQDIWFNNNNQTDLYLTETQEKSLNPLVKDFYSRYYTEDTKTIIYKMASDCYVENDCIYIQCEEGNVDINTYIMSSTVETTNALNVPTSILKNGKRTQDISKIDFRRKHIRNCGLNESYAFEKIPLLNFYNKTFLKYFKSGDFLFKTDSRYSKTPSIMLFDEDDSVESEVYISTKKHRTSNENTAIISKGLAKMFIREEEVVDIVHIQDSSPLVLNKDEVKSWANGITLDITTQHLTDTGMSTVGKELLPGDFIYLFGNKYDDNDKEFIYKIVPNDCKKTTIKSIDIFVKEFVYKSNAYIRMLISHLGQGSVKFLENDEVNDMVIYITYVRERNLSIGDYLSTRYGIGGFVSSIIDIDEPIVTFGYVDTMDEEHKVIHKLETIYKENCEYINKGDFVSLKQSLCKYFLLNNEASQQECLDLHYSLEKGGKYILKVTPGESFAERFGTDEDGLWKVTVGVSKPRYYSHEEIPNVYKSNRGQLNVIF